MKTDFALSLLFAVALFFCPACNLRHPPEAYREIHAAARDGDLSAVAADLSQAPGDLNLPDDAGLTPLHLAASYCHTNVIQFLLVKGAKIDCPARDGATPLHLAAQEGCTNAVLFLILNGAEVNPKDHEGRTPLKRAEEWRQDATVGLLRSHGGTE